jgi:ribosome modulation factor
MYGEPARQELDGLIPHDRVIHMKLYDIDQQHWSIDNLNKAYRQGYLFGLSGESQQTCPYQSDVIAAAWEAGWQDGRTQSSPPDMAQQQVAIA